MARTSKTRMTNSGESGDRMVRASAQGQQSVDRGRQALNSEKRDALNRAETTAGRVGSLMSQHAGREQQGEQFDRQMANQESRTDLDAAKSGFERGGGGGGDRAAALEQEMARGAEQMGPHVGELDPDSQQRIKDQTSKPMEHDGRWRSTEERKQEKAFDQKQQAFKADTDRIKAETYRDQVGQSVQKAQAAGQVDEAKELRATLAKPINGDVKKFDRMMSGDTTDMDWSDLNDMAKGSAEMDPSLAADIQSKSFTPRVQQFMRSQISREALKYAVRTGSIGDLSVDMTAPQMRAFTEQVSQFNALAKSMGPEFSQFAGIRSVEDKMAFLNTQAAMAVLTGMDQQQAPDPTGGMTPSLGDPAAQAEQVPSSPSDDPNAVQNQDSTGTHHRVTTDAETQKAIEDRKAGKWTPPADQPQRRPPARPSYAEMRRSGL